jgi:hypothetical protein
MRSELLPDGHIWYRIAELGWSDPLDPSFAAVRGGRWNPPNSHPTLYLNEDRTTARLNLRAFIDGWPYEPEDLRDDTGPLLVHATLPADQRVADIHSPRGVAAVGLPPSYPRYGNGRPVGHDRCRPIGLEAKRAGLRGVRCRSARVPEGAGRELAWFPAGRRSRARELTRQLFGEWFWG